MCWEKNDYFSTFENREEKMNFHNVKMELAIPMFAGILSSLLLCAVIGVRGPYFHVPETKTGETAKKTPQEEEMPEDLALFFVSTAGEEDDLIQEQYRNPEYREWVIGFFTGICANREIAEAILDSAGTFDIPPALAFALSWEESRFNPLAVNNANRDESIDRGLFQLNNRSFPHLETSAFFDIKNNTHYGISHLRHCLDSGGSEIAALAMYNAGAGRVRTTGTPKVTLDYINRILENRKKIENRFQTRLAKEEEARLAEKSQSPKQPVASAGYHVRRSLTFRQSLAFAGQP